MSRTASPSRSRVLRQKLHTALADAAEANSTGAPQFGLEQARLFVGAEQDGNVAQCDPLSLGEKLDLQHDFFRFRLAAGEQLVHRFGECVGNFFTLWYAICG